MTRVKVCCISSVEEARLAVRLGASALGLVSEMPSGPGVILESLIAEIAAAVPPPIATFLLTSRTNPEEIIAQQRRCRVNTLQFCDALPAGAYAALRQALPGISLVQVIHVLDESSIAEAQTAALEVDALLLDSGRPFLAIKELGGTGRTHDWTLSAEIVNKSRVPVFLAGGLNPENVAEAIRAVRPFGVDLCTGVRTNGALDECKLSRFMEAVSTEEVSPS
jgi:phosphoribosylanthranilate isomerase